MTIQRKLLNDEQRINLPAQIFGIHYPFRVEPFIFNMAGGLSRESTIWTFQGRTVTTVRTPTSSVGIG